MNSKPEDNRELERDLTEFEYAPLPADWKTEMIDNALAESPGSTPREKIVRFSPFQKIALSGIAACWMAIAALQWTMPKDAQPDTATLAAAADSETNAAPTAAESFPLLVRYLEVRNDMTSRF